MRKALMSLVCLTIVLFAEDGKVLVAPTLKDYSSYEALLEKIQQDLNNSMLRIIEASEKEKALDLKKRESFKKGERLFCKNQIVTLKKGWSLEGDLLIKDDRYYSLDECFLKNQKQVKE